MYVYVNVVFILPIIKLFIISGDSSSSSDESHSQASTSRSSVSNFTVSTHSAFQPNAKSIMQRFNIFREAVENAVRLDVPPRNRPPNNLNDESNEDNIQNRTSRNTRDTQETTRSQDFNNRQR